MYPKFFEKFNLNEADYKIIPYNWCPTNFYSVTFEGWKGFLFINEDKEFNNIMKIASKTIQCFIDLYKDTHAFTQPQFYMKPDGTFIIKIGTMEIQHYDERMERNNE